MLTQAFLLQIAYEHQLSPEQEEVFLRKFGERKSFDEIADELSISKIASIQRMGGVYKKFGIEGDTRGKENELRIMLNEKYEQFRQHKEEEIHSLLAKKLILSNELIGETTNLILLEEKTTPADKIGHKHIVTSERREEFHISENQKPAKPLITTKEVKFNNQHNYLHNPLSFSTRPLNNLEIIKDLRQQLHQANGLDDLQKVIEEISFQLPLINTKLPILIGRIATQSKRPELQIISELMKIVLEFLDKLELIIQDMPDFDD
ncbi:MAG: hypothetical protein ACRCT1_14995 [Microcoleaceae cyanobacterium]